LNLSGDLTTNLEHYPIIVSIVLDNFGFVGFEVHKVSVVRVVGGIVMTGGLALILKS